MDRRAFLSVAATAAATATAGCLGGDGAADLDYERCSASFVPKRELPTEIEPEVETAIRDGEYTADTLAYPELVAEDTTLWDVEHNRYYEHHVQIDESLFGRDEETLTLEEVTPERAQPAECKVSNQTDDAVDVSVTIAVDGESLVDNELAVEPTEQLEEVDSVSSSEYVGNKGALLQAPGVEIPRELRGYEVTLTVDSGSLSESAESTVSVTPWVEFFFVQVGSDGVLSGEIREQTTIFQTLDETDSKDGQNWACATPLGGWPEEN